jgi:transforming growth factor-beta-induced protein
MRIRQLMLLLLGGLCLAACTAETPRPTPITVIVPTRAGAAGEVVATQPAFVTAAPNQASLPTATPPLSGPPIVELLGENPDFALFLANLNRTDLIATLQGPGPYTVFAPTNAAFTQLGLASTQIDAPTLAEVLNYHVVEGVVTAADLQPATTLTTLNGQSVTIHEGMTVEYAAITAPDMIAGNGVVHTIDAILLPAEDEAVKSVWGTLVADGRFTRFVALAQDTQLLYNLRFATIDAVLAPTDEAFAQLPESAENLLQELGAKDQLVRYHILAPYGWPRGDALTVASMGEREQLETMLNYGSQAFGVGVTPIQVTLEGDQILLDNIPVVEGDIPAANGTIHVVETVLLPLSLGEHINTP